MENNELGWEESKKKLIKNIKIKNYVKVGQQRNLQQQKKATFWSLVMG